MVPNVRIHRDHAEHELFATAAEHERRMGPLSRLGLTSRLRELVGPAIEVDRRLGEERNAHALVLIHGPAGTGPQKSRRPREMTATLAAILTGTAGWR